MTSPILTKYISSCLYNETAVSKVFLELVDECIWCWYLEALEILKVLSIEDMDISTLLAYFEAYNVKFKDYKDNDLNRYSLINWFNIMHSRGLTKTMESVISINGGFSEDKFDVNDIELYTPADVPYNVVSNPEQGIIYAVTTLPSIDIEDNSLLNQVTPAGYRIIIIKQTPPVVLPSCTSVKCSRLSNKNRSLSSCVEIYNSSIKEKTILNYKSPQFNNFYNFTQLFNRGYSINCISELHSKYNIFSFNIETESEEEEFIISGTFINNENIYITEELKDTTFPLKQLSRSPLLFTENVECYGDTFELGTIFTKPIEQFRPDNYIFLGGNFNEYDVIDVLSNEPIFVTTDINEYNIDEPIYIIDDFVIGGVVENE